MLKKLLCQFLSGHARHHPVNDQEIDFVGTRGEDLQRSFSRGGGQDTVPSLMKYALHGRTYAALIVNEQDGVFGPRSRRGRVSIGDQSNDREQDFDPSSVS